ncbi:hypothetical protein CBR_g8755 [Chara braunii]|nr:hypothetical protein CBR_g8755 [Chara braunii]|eukprot:GBG71334.1 hypothetical protein CBR_g8755 [Chara braunii]
MMAVAIGMVVLVAYAPTVAGDGGYYCWSNYDHEPKTIKRINCKKNPHAASLHGCQQQCDMNEDCEGIVYINGVHNWKKGKICCFLKSDIEEERLEYQPHRTTCEEN